MESEDAADSLDASSSRVLDYYRKYSHDKKLATYFCGDVTISEQENERSIFSFGENLPPVAIVTDVTEHEGERTIVEGHIKGSRPPLIGQDKYDDVEPDDSENEIVRASSPSSSVASNRKLEWDSGADIGYANCHKQKFSLHKSLSLPALTTSDKLESNKTPLRLSPEGKVTESSTQTQQQRKESSGESSDAQVKLTSSSSECDRNPAPLIPSSSSSSYVSKVQDVVSSAESECDSEVKNHVLDFLHKKVGLPVAASTPVYKLKEINLTVLPSVSQKNKGESDTGQECVGSTATNSNSNLSGKTFTSVISVVDNLKRISNGFDVISSHVPNTSKPIYSDLLDEKKGRSLLYVNKKLRELRVTTPLVVECLEPLMYGKKALDKVIQTSPVSYVSIGIQTETDNRSASEDKKNAKNYPTERQGVIYFHHSDSDKEPSSRTLGTNTLSNATDEDVSNCNSFEYLYGDQHDVNSKQDCSKSDVNQTSPGGSTPNDVVEVNIGANNLKRARARSDLNVVSPDPGDLNKMTSSSHESPLGELIARERAKNSEVDVGKNVDLIKKLIKSKKYDKITKQYYIKKIVQTILNSNENSYTSANSDVTPEEVVDKNKTTGSNKPEGFVENLPEQQRSLQENVPWLPAQLRNKQLEVRTFSAEILPEPGFVNNDASQIHFKGSQIKKNSVFTLPSCKDFNYYKTQSSSDHSSSNDVNKNLQQFSTGTSERDSDYVKKINSFQNWKEAKTLSEQRFEQEQTLERSTKNCGDSHSEGDILLNFAKKERENQINWINNEIVHLSKLKSLLQKKDYKVSVDILTKPEIIDMTDAKKSTTSVYVITTEKRGSPKKAGKSIERPMSSNESASSRKETINVKVTSHKREPIWYKNGEKYARGNTPPSQCDCTKSKANNQICTDETCVYSATSRLRKSSPRRTKEISQKEVQPSRLCKCTESKTDGQICSDETCPHLTSSQIRKSSPRRTKESSQKQIRPTTLCKCIKSKMNDEICSDETCPHLATSRLRKSSPRRIAESSQNELDEKSEKLNDDGGIRRLALNSGLKQAKLISSELYSNGLHPHACIRRYVFEIPLTPAVYDKNSPDAFKEGASKQHIKDKSGDEYTTQQIVIEEKMSYPDKRSYIENGVKDQLTRREQDRMTTDGDDDDDVKIQRMAYHVNSYALTEIHGDQSKYITEKDIEGRKLENLPLSSGSYALTEIYKDDGTRDLDKRDRQTSSVASQTSILDAHRSDSENLRKRRTKRSSVSYESSTEGQSVRDRPKTSTHHRYMQKDNLRNVNLQKTDVGDKHVETDKVKTTVSTKTKEKDGRVRYNSGASSSHAGEYENNNLENQARTGKDIKSVDKNKIGLENSKWEDQKVKTRTNYKTLENQQRTGADFKERISEDQKRRTGGALNEHTKSDDQRKRLGLERKYGRSEDQKSKMRSEYRDRKSPIQKRRLASEYKDRMITKMDSEYEGSKLEDQKRRIGSVYKYGKSDDQKKRRDSEHQDRESQDQRRRIGMDYEDSRAEDQERRTGFEYKYSKSDGQEKRTESEYRDGKSEDQRRRKESEYEDGKLDQKRRSPSENKRSKSYDQKKSIESEFQGGKLEDRKRRMEFEYRESKSEDQKRRTGSEYNDRKLEDQKRALTDLSGSEASLRENYVIDYRTDKSSRYVRGEKSEDGEDSAKGKSRRRDILSDDEADDPYATKGNKRINAEAGTMYEKRESNNKVTQTTITKEDKNRDLSSSSSNSSSSETESSSSDSTTYICPCCKKNKSKASALVSNLQRDIQPLLCQPCYTQNRQNNWPNNYRHPGHVCNCYTVLKTETVQQIKRTVDELDDLEREQKYCSCSFVGKNKNVKYCSYCDCKRKSGNKKAMAYMLTFEQGSNESDEEIRQRSSLEEVKVKIPYKKKNKDHENKKRKAKKDNSNHRKHRHQNNKKRKHPKVLTLQEYLSLNRPNFIDNAEQRRKCMIELAYMREERCEKYKQLLALTNGLSPPNNDVNDMKSQRMFSSKKMREITAEKYKKLPEVQQKLKDNRDKQIKKANRLLADIFNKKLRENVLKGRHTLSTSASVIKLI